MKPWLLVAGDFVETGGMDISNYKLAGYLARQGEEVHLVTHRAQANLAEMPNVHVHKVAKPLGSYFLGERLLDRAGREWARKLSPRGGRVIVNGGNCEWTDVNWVHYVHAVYTPRPQSQSPLRGAKLKAEHRLNIQRERRIIGPAKIVIANSERTRRDLVIHVGVPEQRIHTVYYGGDQQRFQPVDAAGRVRSRQEIGLPAGKPLVLFVGALGDRRKGFSVVFQTMQQLCRDLTWDADLVVVGQGRDLPYWQRRAAAANMAGRVHFLGFRKDVPKIMACCDCLVSPNSYEAYGLAVREALCSALPSFVSRTSGVAEEYPKELEPLLLTDYDDPNELESRLRHWRPNAEEYRARLAGLTARLQQWTWDHMAANIVDLIRHRS